MGRKGKKSGRISGRVREAVRTSGMTQAEICRRTGLDKAALSRFMNGRRGLTTASVDRLAEVLNLDLVQKRKRTSRKKGG